jgi:hypothetical protein
MSVDQLDGWKFSQIVGYLFLSLLGFLGVRSINRIDALEKNAIGRDEFDKAMDQIRTERAAMHAENRDYLRRIEEKLDIAAMASLTELVRFNGEQIRELREWKQEKIDPSFPGEFNAIKAQVDRLTRKVFEERR